MEETLEFLRGCSRLLVTTHDFPDGDGLGSQVALHLALGILGKHSFAINPGPTPAKFSLVDPKNQIQIFSPAKALPTVDAVVVLDTNELKMMGPMEEPIRESGKPVIFIDHHVPETMPAGPHFVDESFAATGELVYTLIESLGIAVDSEIATALYVAILTDTAGFRYKRTSPLSHRIAAELLEQGVAPERVYHSIFARESVAKMRLLGHTLERIETSANGKLAWVLVPAKERHRFGATIEDTESFVSSLGLLQGVEIAVLFREEDDGRVKISLRGLADTPIIDIAHALGGGGHRFAAGARIREPMDQVVRKVLAACEALLEG